MSIHRRDDPKLRLPQPPMDSNRFLIVIVIGVVLALTGCVILLAIAARLFLLTRGMPV